MENNIFDQVANRYDSEKQLQLASIIAKEVKLELENFTSKTLIDYGCGTGLVGLELTDEVESVLFVDSSEQMLEIVKHKLAQRKIQNSKVMFSDFTKDTPDFKADIVLMSLVLLHIPNTEKVLQQLFDVLNEGGQLIIVDFDKNEQISHPTVHNGFIHEDLRNLLSEIGFKSTEIKTFYHGKQIFMNQDASMFIATSSK